MQNNFGKYLDMVMTGTEIIVTKNGHEVGRFVPNSKKISYLTDSLRGMFKNADLSDTKEDYLNEKYDHINRR